MARNRSKNDFPLVGRAVDAAVGDLDGTEAVADADVLAESLLQVSKFK
jgi:hypothetical protein